MVVIIALILAIVVLLVVIAYREYQTGELLFPQPLANITNETDVIKDIQLSNKIVDMLLSNKSDFDYSVIKIGDLYVRHQFERICFYVSNNKITLDEIGRIPAMYISPEGNNPVISLRYKDVIDVQKCIDDNEPTIINKMVNIRLHHSSYGYSMTNHTCDRYVIGLDGKLYSIVESLNYVCKYELIDLKCISDESLEYLKGLGYE